MNLNALFSPFRYKGLTLRNHFVMAPMSRSVSSKGVPNELMKDYYARRAKAQVCMILTEANLIDRPFAKSIDNASHLYGDKPLKAWRVIADAVHEQGGKIAPQLWHIGGHSSRDVRSSAYEGPDIMTIQDIEDTIRAYANAAKAAKEAGFDALEIHGAHGYLIDQFFWKETNHRTDEYGGKTLKDRTAFAVALIKEIRRAVGPDFVLLLRLSQWKTTDYGSRLAESAAELEEWIVPLVDAGIDIFHGSQRRFWTPEFAGSDLNFAGWLKKVSGQPSITVGSVGLQHYAGNMFTHSMRDAFMSPCLLELQKRYDRGDFDLIAVGRALLHDPLWVEKIKDGRHQELTDFDPQSLYRLY